MSLSVRRDQEGCEFIFVASTLRGFRLHAFRGFRLQVEAVSCAILPAEAGSHAMDLLAQAARIRSLGFPYSVL
jgi:hypothetical protein